MATGVVKWFSAEKGFGFCTPDGGGKDLFVHHTQIKSDQKFKTLTDGQKVSFDVGESDKGPRAINVVAI